MTKFGNPCINTVESFGETVFNCENVVLRLLCMCLLSLYLSLLCYFRSIPVCFFVWLTI